MGRPKGSKNKSKIKITEKIVPVIKEKRKYNKKQKIEVPVEAGNRFKHNKDGYTYYVFEKKKGKEPELVAFTEYCDKVDNLVKNLSSSGVKTSFLVKKQKTRLDLI